MNQTHTVTISELAAALEISDRHARRRAEAGECGAPLSEGTHIYMMAALPGEVREKIQARRLAAGAEEITAEIMAVGLKPKYRDREITAADFTKEELGLALEKQDFLIAVHLKSAQYRCSQASAVARIIQDIERAAYNGEAIYPRVWQAIRGKDKAARLLAQFWRWEKQLKPWRRDALDRSKYFMLAAKHQFARESARSNAMQSLALADAEVDHLRYLVLETDNPRMSLELFAAEKGCRALVRDAILRYKDQFQLPPSIQRALFIPAEAKAAYRSKVKFRRSFCQYRDGSYIARTGERRQILAGDLFEADDMTVNQPWWVEWPWGGDPCSERYGVRCGRGQLLCFRDVKSGKWLTFTLLMRFRDSYRGVDLLRVIGRTMTDIGQPRVGVRFERGSWESKRIEGIRVYDEDVLTRFGGLEELGIALVHAQNAKGKAFIEQGFDPLQDVLAASSVHVGRHRGEFTEATRKMTACLDGRLHPREAGFLHMDDLCGRITAAMTFLNQRPIMGRIQRGVPDDVWASAVAASPLLPVPVEQRWLFAPERRELSVRDGLLCATHAGFNTVFPFEIADFVGQGISEGFRCVVYFDDLNPKAGAWVFNNETRPINVQNWKVGQFIGRAPWLEFAPQLDLRPVADRGTQGDRRKAHNDAFRESYAALGVFGKVAARSAELQDGTGQAARIEGGAASQSTLTEATRPDGAVAPGDAPAVITRGQRRPLADASEQLSWRARQLLDAETKTPA